MGRTSQNKGGTNDPRTEDIADLMQRDLSRGGGKPSHDETGHEFTPEQKREEERQREKARSNRKSTR